MSEVGALRILRKNFADAEKFLFKGIKEEAAVGQRESFYPDKESGEERELVGILDLASAIKDPSFIQKYS